MNLQELLRVSYSFNKKFLKNDMFVLSVLVLNVSLTLLFLYTIGHGLLEYRTGATIA